MITDTQRTIFKGPALRDIESRAYDLAIKADREGCDPDAVYAEAMYGIGRHFLPGMLAYISSLSEYSQETTEQDLIGSGE
jgi:hypothetical protein